MVSSKINDKINYFEKKTIDPEDLGYKSAFYETDILGMQVEFLLGKEKYTYMNKSVIYYPMYTFSGNSITSQIGVYEIDAEKKISILDEDGDVDISKMGDPLLYSFVTPEYIKKATYKTVDLTKDEEKATETEKEKDTDTDEENDTDDDDEDKDNDVMKLKKSDESSNETKSKSASDGKEGIFIIDKHVILPEPLKEETEAIADEIKTTYKKSSGNNWLENFFNNHNYKIVDVESNGDCFFAVIREAFHQIGKNTTVQKLRKMLSDELVDEVFQEKRNLYLEFDHEIKECEVEMNKIKKANKEYIKRMENVLDKEDRTKIMNAVEELKRQYKKKSEQKQDAQKLQTRYIGYMKEIDTFEKYRDYIQTSSYWADAWAISTLERLLNVKLVILSEESFNEKSLDGVMNCGEANIEIEKTGTFSPKHYIITTYSGNHYRLVTYKSARIFTFREIPYDIKVLIVNKCLEKNAGIFYLIQDVRNFKSKLGIDPDEGRPDDDEDDEENENSKSAHLYKPDVLLMFYSASQRTAKPGKGSHEKIPKDRVKEFLPLSKIEDWRLKLDDSWTGAQFTVDHHKWASVDHYFQGAKYKKGFPDFYLLFSLDSGSDISTDVAMAKAAGESGKLKGKILRPKEVKPDVDYKLGRDIVEREVAVKAKFAQEDMKQLLLATNDALLKHFIRRNPPETDTILMKIRADLRSDK
jgi:hypothetical protein